VVELSRASVGDAEAIYALMRASFGPFEAQYTPGCFDATVLDPERIQRRIDEGVVWMARIGGRLIGTVGAVSDGERLYARGMAVDPAARSQGVGGRLLEAVQAHAREAGYGEIWLSTTTFLDASQRLYERFGMLPCAGPTDLHGTPLVSFCKSIGE
jgi:GNAT superfamily N-acetyltransferase